MAHSGRQELSRKHSDDGEYLCFLAEHPDTEADSIISITTHKKSQTSLLIQFLRCPSLLFHDAFTVNTTQLKSTLWKLNTLCDVCVFLCQQKNFSFSVFAVIENGTEDFDEPDTKTDSFQVRNLLGGSSCVWILFCHCCFTLIMPA